MLFKKKHEKVLEPDGSLSLDSQDWQILFKNHKTKLNVYGITKKWLCSARNGSYLHAQLLTQLLPKRNLYAPEYYCLEYRLPEAPFDISAALDDPLQLCRAYDDFLSSKQKFATFYIVPKEEKKDLFDKDPPKTVQSETLKTKPALTRYIVDLYAAGKIDLDQLDHTLTLKLPQLRTAVYFLLPPSEQRQHEYLRPLQPNDFQPPSITAMSRKEIKKKRMLPATSKRITISSRASLEERFLAGLIDIDTYADLKDPARKLRRQQARASYPLPEALHTCVICARPNSANIKCMECPSMACSDCIRTHFTECPQRAYVLMHHIFCLKFAEPLSTIRISQQRSSQTSRGRPTAEENRRLPPTT